MKCRSVVKKFHGADEISRCALSPYLNYVYPLKYRYFTQPRFLKHPQSLFVPEGVTTSTASTRSKQNYSSLYFNVDAWGRECEEVTRSEIYILL